MGSHVTKYIRYAAWGLGIAAVWYIAGFAIAVVAPSSRAWAVFQRIDILQKLSVALVDYMISIGLVGAHDIVGANVIGFLPYCAVGFIGGLLMRLVLDGVRRYSKTP